MSSILTLPANWNTEINPRDEIEFLFDTDYNTLKKDMVISFPGEDDPILGFEYYAQGKLYEPEARILVAAIKAHFNF